MRTLLLVPMVMVFPFAASTACAGDWSVVNQRGTVLTLEGNEWSEIERNAVLSASRALRTLQGGRLELTDGYSRIRVGPNTVFELLIDELSPGTTTIRQHSGTLTLNALPDAPTSVQLETSTVRVVPGGGIVTVSVADGVTGVVAEHGGKATVTNRETGAVVAVASGQAVSGSSHHGVVVDSSGGNGGGNPNADFGDQGKGASNASGNTNGDNGDGSAGNGSGNSGNGNGGNVNRDNSSGSGNGGNGSGVNGQGNNGGNDGNGQGNGGNGQGNGGNGQGNGHHGNSSPGN